MKYTIPPTEIFSIYVLGGLYTSLHVLCDHLFLDSLLFAVLATGVHRAHTHSSPGVAKGRLYLVDWTVGMDSQKVALVISEGQKTGNCGTAL